MLASLKEKDKQMKGKNQEAHLEQENTLLAGYTRQFSRIQLVSGNLWSVTHVVERSRKYWVVKTP